MSFAQKIESDGKYIFYIKATDANNSRAWYFVQIRPEKLVSFKAILQQGAYTISDYGSVINSGFGPAAPLDIIKAINQKYSCDFS